MISPPRSRVLYVEECMRDHPGPHYEMVNKCSCALDAWPKEVKYEDYTSMSTTSTPCRSRRTRRHDARQRNRQPQIKRYRICRPMAEGVLIIDHQYRAAVLAALLHATAAQVQAEVSPLK